LTLVCAPPILYGSFAVRFRREGAMGGLIIRFIIMTVAVLIAGSVIPGFTIASPLDAFIAAVILSLLNSFVRPILVLLTLPINLLTLGLFTLVINGILVALTALFVKGFTIDGFFSAILGALVVSIVATLLNLLVGDKKEKK
jgi:putative membrane protein